VDPSLPLAPNYSIFFLKKKRGYFSFVVACSEAYIQLISGVHDFKAIYLQYNINNAESIH